MTAYTAVIVILALLCGKLMVHARFESFNAETANDADLTEYRKYLTDELERINQLQGTRTKRSVSPISSSLPNRESTYFLNRIGALQKSLQDAKNQTSESIDQPKTRVEQPYHNITEALQECKRLTQPELVAELKQKGTYNPELMAWDALGVIRFLDRTIHDQYQRESPSKNRQKAEEVVERNVEALARLLKELNVSCDVTTPAIRAKLQNITFAEPRRSIISPSLRRSKRMASAEKLMGTINRTTNYRARDTPLSVDDEISPRQKLIGESHVVPFGCDKRGAEEDGYLRLCGACQAIRRLPDNFFPPFINEVTCDTDKACLYFYDYPHGKCRQKHMNFVVLRNIGTKECQIWKKFNLNVRVSCECFVDEMSFFAKYV